VNWELLLDRVVPWLLVAQFFLILWNRNVVLRPRHRRPDAEAPLISVLIPARDEAETIGPCLAGVLAQDYPNLEVIVLDDRSRDETADIVRGFDDPRLRLVAGTPLPPEWTGKNWACAQLVEHAAGDLLCFVDADTTMEPETIAAASAGLVDAGAGLVSLLPKTSQGSAAGKVLLPMVAHATFGLFPVAAIHSDAFPKAAAAFGPFILVTREAYEATGGHAAHPDHLADDLRLAHSVKASGRRVRLFNGTDLIDTPWYREVGEIWNGFAKNAYSALDRNPWVASLVVFVLGPLLVSPVVRLGFGLLGDGVSSLLLWQVLLLTANRILTSHLGRDSVWAAPFHAVTVAFWAATLWWSMVLTVTGREVVWKGRAFSAGWTDEPGE
jgi:hypothetical protein